MIRPKRSVEMPPTKPAGAPKRAMPTAMLRQDPPATGTAASRPSADLTGRKSTRASPQLSSIEQPSTPISPVKFDFHALHHGFPDPVFASVREPFAWSDGIPPLRAASDRSLDQSPTSRPLPHRSIRETSPQRRRAWQRQAGQAPVFRE